MLHAVVYNNELEKNLILIEHGKESLDKLINFVSMTEDLFRERPMFWIKNPHSSGFWKIKYSGLRGILAQAMENIGDDE